MGSMNGMTFDGSAAVRFVEGLTQKCLAAKYAKYAKATGRVAPAYKVVWVLIVIFAASCLSLSAQTGAGGRVPERLMVKPKHGVSEAAFQAILARQGVRQAQVIEQINVRLVHVPETRFHSALAALQHNPNIEFAEPDYLLEPALVPNDPYYASEWHLAKIEAPAVWDVTTGSSNVVVAVLDSGVDGSHPDLAPLMIPGWNFNDGNTNTMDSNGHGTAVAGTAVASGNNGVGVAGVSWGCRIMPVRITDTNGNGTISMISSGLTWAADQGARVANVSFTVSASPTVTSAAQYFQSKGGVVAVAAGNNGVSYSNPDNPYVLTVSATDSSDVIATWSTTGSNIDLCAPGTGIITTGLGGGYSSASGTSFSAPIVAGVAALVLSINPVLSGTEVQNILKQNADDLGTPGWDTIYGCGRVNARRAALAALAGTSSDTNPPGVAVSSPAAGSIVSNSVTINVTASDNVGVTSVKCFLDGLCVGTNTSAPASFSWDTTGWTNGSYTLQAQAYDAAGNVGTSSSVNVTVQNPVPDTTPPAVAVTAPTNGSTLTTTVTVSVSATDNVGVTLVKCYLNGVCVATNTGAPASFIWDTTGYANGAYSLQATAYDAAGNSGSSPVVNVTVQNPVPDTTPPTAQILSPANGATLAGINSVNVSASDNVGVTKVEWYLDGGMAGSSASSSPAFSWDTTKSINGTHSLQAKAYDAAGNIGSSALVSVAVQNLVPDTTPPSVQITSPGNSATLTSKTTKVYVVASDNVGVTRVDLTVDGKFFATSSSATPTFSWNTGKIAKGAHTLQSTAYDGAGNTNRSAVVTVYK